MVWRAQVGFVCYFQHNLYRHTWNFTRFTNERILHFWFKNIYNVLCMLWWSQGILKANFCTTFCGYMHFQIPPCMVFHHVKVENKSFPPSSPPLVTWGWNYCYIPPQGGIFFTFFSYSVAHLANVAPPREWSTLNSRVRPPGFFFHRASAGFDRSHFNGGMDRVVVPLYKFV